MSISICCWDSNPQHLGTRVSSYNNQPRAPALLSMLFIVGTQIFYDVKCTQLKFNLFKSTKMKSSQN